MKIALLGAVKSTEVALQSLVESGREPQVVVTLSRERASRHSDYVDLTPQATRYGVRLESIASAKSDYFSTLLREHHPDILLVVGWSEILPGHVISTPVHGCLGYHPGPLPEMRGRAVIPWTILSKQTQSGGTIFWLSAEVDQGDIAYQRRFEVVPRESAATLYEKHMAALRAMLKEFYNTQSPGDIPRLVQHDSKATYCAQRKPEDGHILWHHAAEEIDRLVRATTHPYPGAWTTLRSERNARVTVWNSEPVEARFLAVPGQVVMVENDQPVVACGSGFIRMVDFELSGGSVDAIRTQDRFVCGSAPKCP